MKRVLIALVLCLSFALPAAFAADGAALYEKRCSKCHGADGAKTSGASGGVMLKGQSAEDVLAKLKGYQDGSFGGDKKKTMMRLMKRFSEAEIQAMADYVGSL